VAALAPLMLRKKSREEFIEAGYHRYANNDDESILPQWFVDYERKHQRKNLPVTKEEAVAMREEARIINSRPIKKVAEARARKKRKDSRRMEKVRAKAESIAEADDVNAKAKMRAIEKLMKASKAAKPGAAHVLTEIALRSGRLPFCQTF
jgi:AdoMet-dependent rRNA methyltransferase SPB1